MKMARMALRARRRLSAKYKRKPTISARQEFLSLSDKPPKCGLLRLYHGKRRIIRPMWVSFHKEGVIRKIVGVGAESGFVQMPMPPSCLMILKKSQVRNELPACKNWQVRLYWNKRMYATVGMTVIAVDSRESPGRKRAIVAVTFQFLEHIA